MDWFKNYNDLVDTAFQKGKLSEELCGPAKEVFKKRTAVVHKGAKVGHDDAQGVLVQARLVIRHRTAIE